MVFLPDIYRRVMCSEWRRVVSLRKGLDGQRKEKFFGECEKKRKTPPRPSVKSSAAVVGWLVPKRRIGKPTWTHLKSEWIVLSLEFHLDCGIFSPHALSQQCQMVLLQYDPNTVSHEILHPASHKLKWKLCSFTCFKTICQFYSTHACYNFGKKCYGIHYFFVQTCIQLQIKPYFLFRFRWAPTCKCSSSPSWSNRQSWSTMIPCRPLRWREEGGSTGCSAKKISRYWGRWDSFFSKKKKKIIAPAYDIVCCCAVADSFFTSSPRRLLRRWSSFYRNCRAILGRKNPKLK